MFKLNTKSKFHIITYGCQMNESDTERFDKILTKAGLNRADDMNETDILVFNSCSVRQKAEDRILGMRKVIERIKKQNPKLVTVLTGCMARRKWDNRDGKVVNDDWIKKLQTQMPWMDYIIETPKFPQLLPELIINNFFDIDDVIKNDQFYDITPKYKSTYQAYLPISTGCDHFCSYCIVPFARGREVCFSYEKIYKEFKNLVEKGYKDITLVGQIVNRWVNPLYKGKIKHDEINSGKYLFDEPADFLQLLQKLDEIPGDYWMTFTSSHPMYFTDEIIEFFAKAKHIRPYLHFAMQSGNDRILEKMRRDYKYKDFKDIVFKFKDVLPQMAISTDVIVGFPTETEEEFLDTAKAMEECEFDMAFLSEYSPRLGTASAQMEDDINHHEKERRKNYLNEILKKTSGKQKRTDVGKNLKSIAYRHKDDKTLLRTSKNREVMVDGIYEIGKFYNVEILDATDWSLRGKITS